MSTTPSPAPASPPPPAPTPARPTEVKIYSHSNLFYWWPVWLIGFIMGLITLFSGEYLVVVPNDAEAKRDWKIVTPRGGQDPPREGILLPADSKHHLEPKKTDDDLKQDPEIRLHATSQRYLGVLYAVVLLIVIFITNVPLRGMWSLMIIMMIIMLSIIFGLAGIWDRIFAAIKLLDIRINMGGYFLISVGLLGLWAFAFFFFDRQVYIIFQPGALKVCLEIGAGEKQYDTIGMTIEKERSDLFRHWILGLGSGDLIVRTSGADRHEFRLNNVLFISRKLAAIEDMQRIRQERTA